MSRTETEVKLRLENAEDGLRRLQAAGATPVSERLHETNQLWDTPANDLRRSGRMLRVRQFGQELILTCKGPRISSDKFKSRPEFEVTVKDLGGIQGILDLLGYTGGFRYEKFRTEWQFRSEEGHILLDETPIGSFFELEGSEDWIDDSAKRLGFDISTYITDSYGELFRQYCLQQNLRAKDMLFKETVKTR